MDDLQLDLSLSNNQENSSINNKKRIFLQSFPQIHIQQCFVNDVEEEDTDGVMMGWPPVKHHHECTAANYTNGGGGGGGGGGGRGGSNYVKVEMEGIGIGRKIDLSIHHSYQSLTPTLLAMFGKRQENLKMYKLTYRDKDGDWLLAEDVPWGRFVRSVRRLKLLRKDW